MLEQEDLRRISEDKTDDPTYPLPENGQYVDCWEKINSFDELMAGDRCIVVDPYGDFFPVVADVIMENDEIFVQERGETIWEEYEMEDGDIHIYALKNPITDEEIKSAKTKIKFDSLI